MLEAHNLSKTYTAGQRPVTAVADISLDLAAGEFVAVCGRSGSGKSTLLGMLGGICRPTTGTVRHAGIDLWSLPRDRLADFRNRRVGFVFQFAGLLPALRVIDNVALPALLAGRAASEAYVAAEKLSARVGLGDRLEAYPGELSGGQQRRVALARALVNEPRLILADEPTADLDQESEADVFRLLLELRRERGCTLLLVTHNPGLAQEADRVIHLRCGTVLSVAAGGHVPRTAPAERLPKCTVAINREPAGAVVGDDARRALGGLGASFGRYFAGVGSWAAVFVVAALLVNGAAALYQQSRVVQRRDAKGQLQQVALYRLRAEVEDIVSGPDRSYLLTLNAQNLEPDKDLFMMAPEARALVQVGLGWQEVPLRSEDNQQGQVVRVTADKHRFHFRFTPDVKAFEEVLPGYMHVRFSSAMLVSRSAQPQGDLIERLDEYYVFLKPHDADDAAILRRTQFPGKPPLWIPMPPH
jgi:putative ABC transport system ATP-binding protein/macrolide transport system ATP-binding/permease protein/lipoprotein-releasing system ATP-binding protein